MISKHREAAATAALVAATAIWGLTFVLVKEAVAEIPVFEFLAIRFGIAALALALVFGRSISLRRGVLVAGVAAGAALAAGYALQTLGLEIIGATRAGFITGLFVVFTPPLALVLLRRAPDPASLAGVVLATGGLLLLTGATFGRMGRGDLLVLGCAVAFAVHTVVLGKYAPSFDVRSLTLVQMTIAAASFLMISAAVEAPVAPSPVVWRALAVTSLGASAFGFLAQTWAQSMIPPTRAAVTLTMEPVFAGAFGVLLLDERLTLVGWSGAGLILVAMLIASSTASTEARLTGFSRKADRPDRLA